MRTRRRRAGAAIACVLAVTALGGCVSLPTSGPVPGVKELSGSEGSAQQGIQVVPRPPGGPSWSPEDIVSGFIAASGSSFPNVAYAYLDSRFRSEWRLNFGSPTVLDPAPSVTQGDLPKSRLTANLAAVDVTSQQVEALQSAGNIVVKTIAPVFRFDLVRVKGSWRIDGIYLGNQLQRRLLLLAEHDFVRDYQPRNLYFFPAHSNPDELIPAPVFVPQQAGTQAVAQDLATDLVSSPQNSSGPPGWLNDATTTKFPVGTTISVLVPPGVTADVTLGGTAARASAEQLRQMEEQLVWTLTSTSYSASPGIQSVVVTVDRKGSSPSGGGQPLLLNPSLVPTASPSSSPSMYFQASGTAGPGAARFRSGSGAAESGVSVWNGRATAPATLPGKLGQVPFTATAVSANGGQFAGCRGKTVYIAALRRKASVITQMLPVDCTSLSWDTANNLWVPAGHEILVMKPGGPSGMYKQVEAAIPAKLAAGRLTSLQVAGDGVRAAMIVTTTTGGKSSSQIQVAAISRVPHSFTYLAQDLQWATVGSDLANPIALTWWDPDHLLVLTRSGSASPRLYVVPLNGEASSLPATLLPPGVISLAADWPTVAVGTAAVGTPGTAGYSPPLIWTSDLATDGPWTHVADGISPVYPG